MARKASTKKDEQETKVENPEVIAPETKEEVTEETKAEETEATAPETKIEEPEATAPETKEEEKAPEETKDKKSPEKDEEAEKTEEEPVIPKNVDAVLKLYPNYRKLWVDQRGIRKFPEKTPKALLDGCTLYTNPYFNNQ